MLVGLGARLLHAVVRGDAIHAHVHIHGGRPHLHPHVHAHDLDDHAHGPSHRRPFLVGLVHGLDLPVIAEGVEQPQEADRLDELGVAYQQGFLHSRPLRAHALPDFWSG